MLLIQNKGVAPTEAYTLLGASGSRDCGVDGVIGMFGTGAKHAINVLLRARVGLIIYCGKTKLVFDTRPTTINGVEQEIVTVQIGNRKPIDLGWVLAFGAIDWTEVRMALREFVANALDQTVLGGDTINEAKQAGDLRIEITDSPCRAADGYTRVYIGDSPDVIQFVKDLDKHFLHFQGRQEARIISKRESGPCRVYREGVFVCELGNNAICDYNLRAEDISIDECRNLNEYTARAGIARLYRNAEPFEIARVIKALLNGEQFYEAKLDGYWLRSDYSVTDKQKKNWQEAWAIAAGASVLCPSSQANMAEFACRKGHDVQLVLDGVWEEALSGYGVKTVASVLSGVEVHNCNETEPTQAAQEAFADMWAWLKMMDMAKESAPRLRGFEQLSHAAGSRYGYRIEDAIYIRNDLEGEILEQTILEELAHYVTDANDASRDLQEFAFRLAIKLMK